MYKTKYELKNSTEKRGIALREILVQQKIGKYYALIIGINDYEHLTKLNGALKDAQDFKELLEREFYISEVFYLPDAKSDKILDTLDELTGRISEDDNIIIFYAGHGHWEEGSKNGYWMPKDAETNKRKYWMPNSRINDYIRQFGKCKHVLVISDSCYSGALLNARSYLDINNTKKDIKVLYKSKSRQVLTSGAKELVPDDSVFFKYLIKTLKENDENAISANTLFAKIRNKVITNSPSEQKPQIGKIYHSGDDGGDFIFFRRENTATNIA